MEDLKNIPTEILIKWEEKIKKQLEYEANKFFWNMVYMKDIYLNKDGDLETILGMEKISLKNLVDKKTGEKIFKDEYQTYQHRWSDRNLKHMRTMWNTYNSLKKRDDEHLKVLSERMYGDELMNPDRTEHEKHEFTLTYKIEILEENIVSPILKPKQKSFIIDYNTCKIQIDNSSNQAGYSMNELFPTEPKLPDINPIKFYKNVNLMDNWNMPGKRKYDEVKIEAEQNGWEFLVDKHSHENENIVDYYLYNAIEYDEYKKSLNIVLLELCKQWNDTEFEILKDNIKKIEDMITKFPTTGEFKIILGHLGKVYFQFENWFRSNQTNKMELKHGDLIKIPIEIYEKLLNNGELCKATKETKKLPQKSHYDLSEDADKKAYPILSKVIPLLDEKYMLSSSNIRSISDYFRQGYYKITGSKGRYKVSLIKGKKG